MHQPHFDEMKYYRFALSLGFSNLRKNKFALGAKKTLGKIFQPINSYTRFPEYSFIGRQIEDYLVRAVPWGERAKILDVASPKAFGLYLAYHFPVEVHLTDIDVATVREARMLWSAISAKAKGTVFFDIQDGRCLEYPRDYFDIVFSMSVIEHVADVNGAQGDSQSAREMLRVLKPRGLMLATVPFGPHYVEQKREGFDGAARFTSTETLYFFQRIYSVEAAGARLIDSIPEASLSRAVTVRRKQNALARLYRELGQEPRALLGSLNPLLSRALNETAEGLRKVPGEYGAVYSERDFYGDLMLAWEKTA